MKISNKNVDRIYKHHEFPLLVHFLYFLAIYFYATLYYHFYILFKFYIIIFILLCTFC